MRDHNFRIDPISTELETSPREGTGVIREIIPGHPRGRSTATLREGDGEKL